MVYYLSYNDKTHKFKNINESRLQDTLKKTFRKGFSIELVDYINTNITKIEPCRICGNCFPPIKVLYSVEKDNFVKITGFEYTRSVYCYGKNTSCPGIKMNPNSKEYISKILNITEEEALEYIKQNNKSPFYKENWNNEEDYQKSQIRDRNFFHEKFGKRGEEKYNEWLSNLKYSKNKEYYIDKFGQEEGLKIWHKVSKAKDSTSYTFFLKKYGDEEIAKLHYDNRLKIIKLTLDNFIKKYGDEEGKIKHNEYIAKCRFINTKEFFVFKYGIVEGEKLWLERNKKCAITIDNLFNKYGCYKKAKEIRDKWLNNVHRDRIANQPVSKESIKLFDALVCELKNIDITDEYWYGNKNYNGRELKLSDDTNNYFYDFTIPHKKIIIEYHGEAFHPNKEKLSEKQFNEWTQVMTNRSADEMYKKDQYKKKLAIENGYAFLEVWSSDKFSDNLNKCLNFIKEQYD